MNEQRQAMSRSRLSLILAGVVLLLLTGTAVAWADLQPDIHLTLYLGDDTWAAELEAPSIFPEQAVAEAQQQLRDNLGIDLQVSTRQRGNRDFLVLRIPFDSAWDMQQAMTRLELPFLEGEEAPLGLFRTFEFRSEDSTLGKSYTLSAELNGELASRVAMLLDVYLHVDMPGTVTKDNAELRDEGLPTWHLSTDTDPTVFIQSRVLFGSGQPSDSDQTGILMWIVLVAGVLLFGVIAGWLIWWSKKRRRRRTRGSTELDPYYRDNDTWPDEISDVSHSYLEDSDGNLINVDEEKRPSQDYY